MLNPEKDLKSDAEKIKRFTMAYADTVDKIFDRLDKIHGPNWSSRNDFAKMVITLSSGILALTVSFSSGILAKGYQETLVNYFMADWSLLMISIFSCVASLWIGMRVTSLQILLNSQQSACVEQAVKLDNQGISTSDFFNQIFYARFDSIFENDKWAYRCLRVGLASFVCSMLLLCRIGQVSFSKANLSSSLNTNTAHSAKSFGSYTGAKCLKSK